MLDVPAKDLLEEGSSKSHCSPLRPGDVEKVSDLVAKTHLVGAGGSLSIPLSGYLPWMAILRR